MRKRSVLVFLLIIMATSLPAGYVYSGQEVYISIVPFHAPEKIWHLYSPFVDYLNKNTKLNWKLKIYPNYESIKKGLCDGEISIALFCPNLAYTSNKECNAKPIITALNENGKPDFRIYIVTADKKIKSIKDLRGHKIGFFKPSTLPNMVTRKMLEDEGLDEGNVKFLIYYSLERIINDVITDELKAGGIRDTNYVAFKDLNLKILKKSEPLPGFAFMASPKAPTNIKKEFIDALLRLNSIERDKLKKITADWDETIRHGFSLPPKDYLKETEKFNILYEKYKK